MQGRAAHLPNVIVRGQGPFFAWSVRRVNVLYQETGREHFTHIRRRIYCMNFGIK